MWTLCNLQFAVFSTVLYVQSHVKHFPDALKMCWSWVSDVPIYTDDVRCRRRNWTAHSQFGLVIGKFRSSETGRLILDCRLRGSA